MSFAQRWSQIRAGGPERLAVTLGLFLAGFSLLPSSKSLNNVYYALVLTPALLLLRGTDWRWLATSRLWRVAMLLLAYLTLSGLWSAEFRLDDWLHEAKALPYLAVYLAVVACVCARRPQHWEHLLRTTALAATIGTVASATIFYAKVPWGVRLQYYGAVYQSIEAATVVGSCLLLVLLHILPAAHGRARRALWLLCSLVLLGGIVLTGSRTPLAAALACIGLGLALRRLWRLLGAIALAAALLVGGLLASSDGGRQALARGDSYRLAIWQHFAARVAQRPWLGEGLLSNDTALLAASPAANAPITILHPHNAYLATALYGGLPALLLLLGLAGLALRQGWQLAARGEPVWLLMLLFALLCMLTDGDRLLHAPRAVWFYFWLPVGALIGRQARPGAGQTGWATGPQHAALGRRACIRSQ